MEKELERKIVFEESLKYKKKFREHAQIPEDDSLTGQKKKIRKKQIQKQMRKRAGKSPEGYPLMMRKIRW
mgnify:CR=1 FL=1